MEGEMPAEEYQEMEGEEAMDEEERELRFQDIKDIIEKTEDEGKDQFVQAQEAKYISKGTYIWQVLSAI